MARTKTKNVKAEAIVELDEHGLVTRLAEQKQELFNLRFQNATGQLDNTSRMGITRREIARINTELRSREIAAAEALSEES
jgi:large subunit ribosomal protein L29